MTFLHSVFLRVMPYCKSNEHSEAEYFVVKAQNLKNDCTIIQGHFANATTESYPIYIVFVYSIASKIDALAHRVKKKFILVDNCKTKQNPIFFFNK